MVASAKPTVTIAMMARYPLIACHGGKAISEQVEQASSQGREGKESKSKQDMHLSIP